MSRPRRIEVTCQGCGSKQAIMAWQSVNISLNPELKTALLEGELTRFTCAQCGSSRELIYPLLYHDMDRQMMITLTVGTGASGVGSLPVDAFMRDYLFRLVTSRNQLVEKIRIFEGGFDDRVLEFVKFLLRRGAANVGGDLIGDLFFNGRGQTDTGDEAILFLLVGPTGERPMATPISQLTEIICEFGDRLPSYESESGQWLTVNENYAASLAGKF